MTKPADTTSYPLLFTKLLDLGEPASAVADWLDYGAACGITTDHIPDLVRLFTDPIPWSGPADSIEVWAYVHARRALGGLRAVAAIKQLLGVLILGQGDGWAKEDVPYILGMAGPDIIPDLLVYFNDQTLLGCYSIRATLGLVEIALAHPSERGRCLALLLGKLAPHSADAIWTNTAIIYALVRMKAVEAAPLIEETFRAGNVSQVAGTWETVRVKLGVEDPVQLQVSIREDVPSRDKLLARLVTIMGAMRQNLEERSPGAACATCASLSHAGVTTDECEVCPPEADALENLGSPDIGSSDLRRCRTCGTLYRYRYHYEFYATSPSVDEYYLWRLGPVAQQCISSILATPAEERSEKLAIALHHDAQDVREAAALLFGILVVQGESLDRVLVSAACEALADNVYHLGKVCPVGNYCYRALLSYLERGRNEARLVQQTLESFDISRRDKNFTSILLRECGRADPAGSQGRATPE